MKEWIECNIQVLNIEDTSYGGTPSRNYDNVWADENGADHVEFEIKRS